jgi:muramoyltetrapeptide carboxypeptidase LdcA involved in peptidoglycan recycling
MVDSVQRALFSSQPIGRIEPNRETWTVETLNWSDPRNQDHLRRRHHATGWRWLQGTGSVEGRLIGGCLEVLDWLRGTPVWPDAQAWQDSLLFLETSEEAPPPQAVIRMLRALAAAGVLQQTRALLVGRPGGEMPVARFDDYDRAIQTVICDELGLDCLPVITCMDFGHTDPMFVIPMGIRARVDCDRQELTILENAVMD